MPDFSITATGLDAAIAALSPARVDAAIAAALAEVGERGLSHWRAATPYRTGRLRRSEGWKQRRFGLDFEAKAFYYGPQNTRRNMTGALVGYLGSAEVRNIILRHLTGAF